MFWWLLVGSHKLTTEAIFGGGRPPKRDKLWVLEIYNLVRIPNRSCVSVMIEPPDIRSSLLLVLCWVKKKQSPPPSPNF